MRLIGEIDHPRYKISLFRLNERLSIKFEDGQFEQIYKIRENSELKDANTLSQLIDDAFMKEVSDIFESMRSNQSKALQKWLSSHEDVFKFPDII